MSKYQQTAPRRQVPLTPLGRNPFKSPRRRPKPPTFKRQVRRQQATSAGQIIFKTKSFSNQVDIYYPVINLETLYTFCTCPGFHYHYARFEPSIYDVALHCCHLKRAIKNCRRRGELPLYLPVCSHGPLEAHVCAELQTCAICGAAEGFYEMVDGQGNVIPGLQCQECVDTAADDLRDAVPDSPTLDLPAYVTTLATAPLPVDDYIAN